jgi:hypothetical protein
MRSFRVIDADLKFILSLQVLPDISNGSCQAIARPNTGMTDPEASAVPLAGTACIKRADLTMFCNSRTKFGASQKLPPIARGGDDQSLAISIQ